MADVQLLKPFLGERALELEGDRELRSCPDRHQQPDPLLVQAAQRDLDHSGGGWIEPLRIVQGDASRSGPLGASTENVAHGEPDRVRIGSLGLRLDP